MKKFYTLAWNKDGKEFILASEQNVKIFAENDIIEQAMDKGLSVDINQVRPFQGTQRGGSTTTKRFKDRKRMRAQGKRTDLMF